MYLRDLLGQQSTKEDNAFTGFTTRAASIAERGAVVFKLWGLPQSDRDTQAASTAK